MTLILISCKGFGGKGARTEINCNETHLTFTVYDLRFTIN